MKNPNKKVQASAIIQALFLAFLVGSLPFPAFAQDHKDTAGIDQLRHKAWKEGKVQVIVHFVVPQIRELAAASAQFWGADQSVEITRDRTVADTNLTQAIEYYSWKILAELQGTEYDEIERFQYVPFIVLRVSPGAFAVLEASSDVLGIEEDYPAKLIDPVEGAGEEGKGENPTAGDNIVRPMLEDTAELVGAKTVWSWGFTGAGWYVAILDTGIRRSHQFFSGKNIIEACRAKGRDGVGPSGDCPNGLAIQNGTGSAVHYASTYEGWDHGTHVAGIATGDYGSLSGIAKDANIIAIKIFSKFPAGDCGGSPCVLSWSSDTIAGLEYVYSLRGRYNISSANLSLGGGSYNSACNSSSYKAAIDLLRSVGIATVIATGNNGYCNFVSSPACVSTSVAVGSSTKSDLESSFNNWHKTMQRLFAPGSSIYSATGTSDSSYESWSGTSMATPHVSGAWALLKQAIPRASVSDILNALRKKGVGIKSVCDGWLTPIPRIQIDKALASLAPFKLTIQASAHGKTSPVPGVYMYPIGVVVQVTAVPSTYCSFINWTGDATGIDNPVSVTMNKNRRILANFRYIYAPAASGIKVQNRSFSQLEYINVLSWEDNPANAGLDITKYKIYLMNNGTPSLLAEVGADQSQYTHHKAGQEKLDYAIVAVHSSGREGAPALVSVQ